MGADDPTISDPPPIGVMVNVVSIVGGVGAVGGDSTTPRVQALTTTPASTTVIHLDNTPQPVANGAPMAAYCRGVASGRRALARRP
jgi:hypothetical protein